MQLITYFGFTLVSILIQFCVMDFINQSIEYDKSIENVSRHYKRDIQAIIHKITDKPHGLYYRTENNSESTIMTPLSLYNNASLVDITTETSSTILEWIYDENITSTEDTVLGTDVFPTSEFENVTAVTLFNNKNTSKPKLTKKSYNENCGCNILYEACDINCCCDKDCTDTERKLFSQICDDNVCQDMNKRNFIYSCYHQSKCINEITTSFLENLFCISKTNLPEKRLTQIQFDEAAIYKYPMWHSSERQDALNEFKKSIYQYKDPIWLFNNESIYIADIPMAISNNYCNGKKPIRFLINENIKCIVKLKDLHMFQTLKYVEGGVASPGEATSNTSVKTIFSRTKWTLFTCDENECLAYNKSEHDPQCTEYYCNNIATSMQYNFYYFNSKIQKAVLKFNIQNVSMQVPYIEQNIKVQFYLSNKSVEEIIKISGSPGYIWNLPVIISSAESNHTLHFFNNTSGIKKYLIYPDNKRGLCILSNVSYKMVQFGQNKRSTCRYYIKQDVQLNNGTSACQFIQQKIFLLLGLNSTLYVSLYGNPQQISDGKWIRLRMFNKTFVYGHIMKNNSQLICYNLITRIGYAVAYANMKPGMSKAQNKILYVNIEGTAQNITFNIDDVSLALAVDTRFIDAGAPNAFQYAGAPHLNLYLPINFFFPSNKGNYIRDETVHLRLLFLLCPFLVSLIQIQ